MTFEEPETDQRSQECTLSQLTIRVFAVQNNLETGPDLAASVIALSETDACLMLTDQVAKGQEVVLAREGPARPRPARLLGFVSYCQAVGGQWLTGVHFWGAIW